VRVRSGGPQFNAGGKGASDALDEQWGEIPFRVAAVLHLLKQAGLTDTGTAVFALY
jgi:hypothetical protein